jgi:hypothetical protein
MNKPVSAPSAPAGGHSSGPHGTRLFSTEDLRQYACDGGFAVDGPASKREPVLEGVSQGLQNLRVSVRPGRQTIGRGGDNDIVIDEPSVSASHGWIINHQGHCVIMNTLSTNGTFVNDRRVHEATLKHGDHIRLGQAELMFLTREHGARSPARRRWITAGLLALAVLGALVWWFR